MTHRGVFTSHEASDQTEMISCLLWKAVDVPNATTIFDFAFPLVFLGRVKADPESRDLQRTK